MASLARRVKICLTLTKAFRNLKITLPITFWSLFTKIFTYSLYKLSIELMGLKSLIFSKPPFLGMSIGNMVFKHCKGRTHAKKSRKFDRTTFPQFCHKSRENPSRPIVLLPPNSSSASWTSAHWKAFPILCCLFPFLLENVIVNANPPPKLRKRCLN